MMGYEKRGRVRQELVKAYSITKVNADQQWAVGAVYVTLR
jgi:hypothetical protein